MPFNNKLTFLLPNKSSQLSHLAIFTGLLIEHVSMSALPVKRKACFQSEIKWIQIELNCLNDKLMAFEKYSDQNAFLHSEYQTSNKQLSTSIYPFLLTRKKVHRFYCNHYACLLQGCCQHAK
jgi:hypothetical protein